MRASPTVLLLCALLPSGFRLVIKREMRTVLLAGRMLSRIGAVFVEREQGKERIADVRTVLKAARSGQSLAIFPEGTFRPEPGLLPFRPGAFAAAAAGELPVVPVAIRGCRRLLPSGSWLFTPSSNRGALSGADQGNRRRAPIPPGRTARAGMQEGHAGRAGAGLIPPVAHRSLLFAPFFREYWRQG